MISTSLTLATLGVSFLAFNDSTLMQRLCFYPYVMNQKKLEWYRFLSHTFVHANWPHLIFNMLALYTFGNGVEHLLGSLLFAIMYFTAAIASSISDYQKNKDNSRYVAVGASGAISAMIFCSILHNPWAGGFLVFFVPVPPIVFGVAYLIYSYYMSTKQDQTIGHSAHFHGAVYGILFTLLAVPGALQRFMSLVMQPQFLNFGS
jgi:membrane associated rhomboid family serine protease